MRLLIALPLLLLVLACTTPAEAVSDGGEVGPSEWEQEADASPSSPAASENRCPTDFDSDTFIDISDVTPVTGRFGQAVTPETARYDVMPEMPGDGFIDIGDLTLVLRDFGTQCFGVVGEETFANPLALGSVFNCTFEGYSWLAARTPTHILVGGHSPTARWNGITLCSDSGGFGVYQTECYFQISADEGAGYVPKAGTEAVTATGTLCGANGFSPAYIQRCAPFRFGMQHAVTFNGQYIHGPHWHNGGNYWVIC